MTKNNMADETNNTFEAILEEIKKLDERVARIENAGTSMEVMEPRGAAPRKTSIKEFLLERKPKDDVQKVLCIGYFLETFEGMNAFNKANLEKGFRSAKEPVPLNINDKVNMCIRKGHMMEAEEKKDGFKAWVITRSGEQIIEKGFVKIHE